MSAFIYPPPKFRISVVRNVNHLHKESLSAHEKIALKITAAVGTMACVYLFTIISLISLPAAITSGSTLIIVGWIAQTFLQLVLLPLLMVGQNLQGKHAELRAENDYQVNLKAEKEVEELKKTVERIERLVSDPKFNHLFGMINTITTQVNTVRNEQYDFEQTLKKHLERSKRLERKRAA